MDEPKVAVLRHYASPYYDPQKAHEYYMRTRELNGRSTTSLNDEGKKIWSYTKSNIKSEKTAKVKEEQEKRDQKITELRAKADATKEQISSRLKELNEALTKNASYKKKSIDTDKDSELEDIEKESSSEKERIDNKKNAEIERLMAIEIPSGLSKAERAKRVAERTEKIAKLRTDAKSDKAKISSDAKSDKAGVRTDATNKKAKVSSDTKEEKAENQAKDEGSDISIVCPNPFFYSAGKDGINTTIFYGVEALFEFPFSNESLQDPLLEMGEIKNETEQVVVYNGDAEIGVTITIHAIGEASNITIYNTGTREVMRIDTDKLEKFTGSGIIAGDEIIICTVKGNKSITLLRNGKTTNILNCLDKNADWFQLAKGDNIFAYTAEYGSTNLQFKIENRIVYEGV